MSEDPLKIIEDNRANALKKNKRYKIGGKIAGYFILLLTIVIGYLAARGLNENLPPLNFVYLIVAVISVSVVMVLINFFSKKSPESSASKVWMFLSPFIIAAIVMFAYKYLGSG